jgi:hypothetical protein
MTTDKVTLTREQIERLRQYGVSTKDLDLLCDQALAALTLQERCDKEETDKLRAIGLYDSCRKDNATKLAELRTEKNEAYRQRNHLVAALARLFPSGVKRTNIEGWDDDWHGCCFIDLPSGQISYHFHDSHAHLFADLSSYTKEWDGHDKETVHVRLAAIAKAEAELAERRKQNVSSAYTIPRKD